MRVEREETSTVEVIVNGVDVYQIKHQTVLHVVVNLTYTNSVVGVAVTVKVVNDALALSSRIVTQFELSKEYSAKVYLSVHEIVTEVQYGIFALNVQIYTQVIFHFIC